MNIKRHICEGCGGQLLVDREMQVYFCQFCGVTYDYEYFKEDDVCEKGDKFVAAGEYTAALDAFRFLLSKDPHNAYALEKVMLLTCGVPSVESLNDKDVLDQVSGDLKSVSVLADQAPEESRDRLFAVRDMLGSAFDAASLNAQVESLTAQIATDEEEKKQCDLGIVHEYIPLRDRFGNEVGEPIHPKQFQKENVRTCIIAWIFVILLFLPVFSAEGGVPVGIVIDLIFTVVIFGTLWWLYDTKVKPALEHIRHYEDRIAKLAASLNDLESRRKAARDEYNAIRRDIKKNIAKLQEESTQTTMPA